MLASLRAYLLAVGVLFLAACSSVSVTTDFDHAALFTRYHTYVLAPSSDPIGLSPSSDTALRETLRNSLARHGVLEATENADLHIVPHLSTKEKIVVNQTNAGLPYRYGRYGMWVGAPNYTEVSQHTEGTLILDFVDAKIQKLVFRGIGTGAVSDPETNAARIKEAVEKIVQTYPTAIKQ